MPRGTESRRTFAPSRPLRLGALTALALAVPFSSPSALLGDDVESAAVVRVVSDAYVDGIHNFRDPAAIRKGFHPGFEMLSLKVGKLDKRPNEPGSEASGRRTMPAIHWNDESMQTGYANICNVATTREEVSLFFGDTRRAEGAELEARELWIELVRFNPDNRVWSAALEQR